jgi:4-amino-4-deoxy-L-arabinose transferase
VDFNTGEEMIQKKYFHDSLLLLFLVFAVLYIFPLGVRPLSAPDETRYGEISREMIASGNYVSPRLNDLRYFEKPVMGYWLNALSLKTFGENNFAVRFSSALSAGISALIVFLFVRRFTKDRFLAFMASAIFLTFLEVVCLGVFSVLDSMVSMFLTGAMGLFLFAWEVRNERPKFHQRLFLFGIFLGLACMIKGFLAFVVPASIMIPFILWEGKWKELFRIIWGPLLAIILVMLPWSILIHQQEHDFWNFFIWNEHIRRFFSDNAQHKASPFYFFIALPLAAIPWTFVGPAALKSLRRKEFQSSFMRFVLCWLVFPFLFFSASSGKLVTYILPCFPPLAILFAKGLQTYFMTDNHKSFNRGAILLAILWCGVILSFVWVQIFKFYDFSVYSNVWKTVLLISGLSVYIVLLLASVKSRHYKNKFILYALSPLFLLISANFLVPDLTLAINSPGEFLQRHKYRIEKDSIIVSDSGAIPSVCWYYKRNDLYQLNDGGELEYGFKQPDARHRMIDFKGFSKLVSQNQGRVVLIIRQRNYNNWMEYLPKHILKESSGQQDQDQGFVFCVY